MLIEFHTLCSLFSFWEDPVWSDTLKENEYKYEFLALQEQVTTTMIN